MLDDIKDSIKAKLYDFTYTPFMGSVLISWVLFNHQYLLIYFTDFDLDKKLPLLKSYDFSYQCCNHSLPWAESFFFPLAVGLFYVYGYPQISKFFYEYTLERTKELKKVKQSIEDETPITQEEAKEIRKDLARMEEEKDKAYDSLRKKDEECKRKVDEKSIQSNTRISTLEGQKEQLQGDLSEVQKALQEVHEELQKCKNNFTQSNKFLESKNDECEQLKKEIEQLKKQIYTGPRLPLGDDTSTQEDIKSTQAYEKIMVYLHNDFDPMPQTSLIEKIVKSTGLGKTLIRHILNNMMDDNILSKNSTSDVITMTKEGAAKILAYIDKHPQIPF